MVNKIAFIGAGSMAEAIIAGIIKQNVLDSEQIVVTNKNNYDRLNHLQNKYDVTCLEDKAAVIAEADIIVLSMKPNDVKDAIQSIKHYIMPQQLIISVVAGVSTEMISNLIQKNVPVIRAMPNTSALIGSSATALTRGKFATNDHLKNAEKLFNTIGITTIIGEEDMHIVTGISGSGPAYVYYLVEAMEQAAIESGCDPAVAKALITQTIIGAGDMLKHSGQSAEDLRENITSPQGTTEAGLKTLASYKFHTAVKACVKSARDRSIELGKMLSSE